MREARGSPMAVTRSDAVRREGVRREPTESDELRNRGGLPEQEHRIRCDAEGDAYREAEPEPESSPSRDLLRARYRFRLSDDKQPRAADGEDGNEGNDHVCQTSAGEHFEADEKAPEGQPQIRQPRQSRPTEALSRHDRAQDGDGRKVGSAKPPLDRPDLQPQLGGDLRRIFIASHRPTRPSTRFPPHAATLRQGPCRATLPLMLTLSAFQRGYVFESRHPAWDDERASLPVVRGPYAPFRHRAGMATNDRSRDVRRGRALTGSHIEEGATVRYHGHLVFRPAVSPVLPVLLAITGCRESPANPARDSPTLVASGLGRCPSGAMTDTAKADVADGTKVKLVLEGPQRPWPNDPPYGANPTDAFFPPELKAFTRQWYGKHLAAMCEPSLWRIPSPHSTILRFLWLRTFHNPIAIRIESTATTARVVATRLDGAGGYEPGRVDARRERDLGQSEWEALRHALQEGNLEAPVPEQFGTDGARWVLEIRTKDTYELIDRWTPSANGPAAAFRRFCELLLDLAGRDLIRDDVY